MTLDSVTHWCKDGLLSSNRWGGDADLRVSRDTVKRGERIFYVYQPNGAYRVTVTKLTVRELREQLDR